MVEIVDHVIDIDRITGSVANPAAGGTAIFIGTTRNLSGGRDVEYLEYEAYKPMALQEMKRIAEDAQSRWPGLAVAMAHRTGRVGIGEASVVIAVSGTHRDEAFRACRYCIDTLKKDVPIWKKEVYREGHRWAGTEREHTDSPGDEQVPP